MTDLSAFLIWLLTIELLGFSILPLVFLLFRSFPDRGFGFSKTLGILLTSWLIWILGSSRILPFEKASAMLVMAAITLLSWFVLPLVFNSKLKTPSFDLFRLPSSFIKLILLEEFLFIAALGFWSFIRGFSPDIHGLEKFMDYGFMLSALRAKFFPPLDHFFAGGTINYYYFGHLIAAVLTKLSSLPPQIAYNLQIANLFALSFLASFSIGAALIFNLRKEKEANENEKKEIGLKGLMIAGLLTAFLVTLAGNLHALVYYPVQTERYWYPDATRFIEYTIDEFPVYSWVVADLHGHVSAIPLALLVIALLLAILINNLKPQFFLPSLPGAPLPSNLPGRLGLQTILDGRLLILAIAVGVNYATNAWNFPIYLVFAGLVFWCLHWRQAAGAAIFSWEIIWPTFKKSAALFILAILVALPFFLQVKPLTGGIGLVGAYLNSRFPKENPFLTLLNLFIPHSPFWKILILWGFFFFLAFSFIFWLFRHQIRSWFKPQNFGRSLIKFLAAVFGLPLEIKSEAQNSKPNLQPPVVHLLPTDAFAFLCFLIGLILIFLPEWIYLKDIYLPDYFRANTMFKFYFQAWLFMGTAGIYSAIRLFAFFRQKPSWLGFFYRTTFLFLLSAVAFYPYLAIRSATNNFRGYKGLDGTQFMQTLYPADWQAIQWLDQNVSGQPNILEAVGESYTDYARVSGLTGIPTVLGWPVHEWLWRGSFGEQVNPKAHLLKIAGVDSVAGRTSDVQQIYETESAETARNLLQKYQVSYVFLGQLEHEKYPNLKEEKFEKLGKVVFENEATKIYQVEQ